MDMDNMENGDNENVLIVTEKGNSFIDRVLRSKQNEYLYLKLPFGTAVGAGIGFGYFVFGFGKNFKLDFDTLDQFETYAFAIIMVVATFACTFSTSARAIMILCIPTMLGRTGRSIIHASITLWIMQGPVANILNNSGLAVDSLTCISTQQTEHTKRVFNLLHSPLSVGFRNVADSRHEINESLHHVKSNVDGLEEDLLEDAGLEDPEDSVDEVKNDEKKKVKMEEPEIDDYEYDEYDDYEYDGFDGELDEENAEVIEQKRKPIVGEMTKNSVQRCRIMLLNALDNCLEAVEAVTEKCYKYSPLGLITDLICHFAGLKTINVCRKITPISKQQCTEDSLRVENGDLIDGNYTELNVIDHKIEKGFESSVEWEVPENIEVGPITTVEEINTRIQFHVVRTQRIFNFSLAVMKKIVAITFFLVLVSSISYHKSYMCDFKFDNVYITPYFVRKDAERKAKGKRHLLPLRRIEKRYVTFPNSLNLTPMEKRALFFRVVKLVAEVCFTGMLYVFNNVIYQIMFLIRKHARIELSIKGRHKVQVDVSGNGSVFRMMEYLFKPFDENNEVVLNITATDANCLPTVRELPSDNVSWVFGMYGFLLVAVILDSFCKRVRRVICSIAHRRREKNRIIQLYGDMMRQRKNYIFRVHKTIKKLARNYHLQQKHSILVMLRLKSPLFDKLMRRLKIPMFYCLVCEEPERRDNRLIRCQNVKCRLPYCDVCWSEIEDKCWACEHYAKEDYQDVTGWKEDPNNPPRSIRPILDSDDYDSGPDDSPGGGNDDSPGGVDEVQLPGGEDGDEDGDGGATRADPLESAGNTDDDFEPIDNIYRFGQIESVDYDLFDA